MMEVATQRAATNPRTGCIDMDMIATGTSAEDVKTMGLLENAVEALIDGSADYRPGKQWTFDRIFAELERSSDIEVDKELLSSALKRMTDVLTYNSESGLVRLS